MDAYLWPTGFMPSDTKIIRQRKKDFGEIEKTKKSFSSLCIDEDIFVP